MTKDEELELLRAEKTSVSELLQKKDEQLGQARSANQTLREGLRQALIILAEGWFSRHFDEG